MSRTRRSRRLSFLAQFECLEPRWLMSGLVQEPDLVDYCSAGLSVLAAGNLTVSADQAFTPTAAEMPGYSYQNPPPLPPSNSATTVNVSTVNQLVSAIKNLQSGQTISIAAGTYNLAGLTDALYIPQGITNWTVRGATGDRDDVLIRGGGMNGSVRFGFWIGTSAGGTIADLTIDGVRDHGIIANAGANDLLVHNVRIVDSGDQSIKSNPGTGGVGNSGGVVEYSVFEYRTTDNNNYTNGVDVHGGSNWIVRYNLFKNFLSPAGQGLAGPAILMWNGTTNSIIESNTFINVARGISLGLIDRANGFDHQGGVVRNNMFYRDPNLASAVDVPILIADSPNTQVYHNTLIARGSYPNAIEYRFGSTTGLQIKNNLTDGAIRARDGASGTLGGNRTNATLSLFGNPTAGDLHLVAGASPIDQGVAIAGLTNDFDNQTRDSQLDVGADEYVTGTPPPDTTAPTIGGVGSSGITHNAATIAWATNEASDTQVEYGLTTSYGSSTTLDAALVTSHSAGLSGLAAETTYQYRVKSRDAAGNLSTSANFTFTTSLQTSPIQIIDNRDAAFSTIGQWFAYGAQGYKGEIHYAAAGNSAVARWAANVTPGQYRVSVTWYSDPNRATNSPFSVLDGANVLSTTAVNQELVPADFADQGVAWRDLGTFNIVGNTLAVELGNEANEYVIADAIRIERLDDAPPPPPPPPPTPGTAKIPHRDAGFSAIGQWFTYGAQGYAGEIHYAAAGDSSVARWSANVTPGQYRVSVTWYSDPNRATNSPFSVLDGADVLSTSVVNQELVPADFTDQGAAWHDLGTFQIVGNTIVVALGNEANEYVIADAIRIERIGDAPTAGAQFAVSNESGLSDLAWLSGTTTEPELFAATTRTMLDPAETWPATRLASHPEEVAGPQLAASNSANDDPASIYQEAFVDEEIWITATLLSQLTQPTADPEGLIYELAADLLAIEAAAD